MHLNMYRKSVSLKKRLKVGWHQDHALSTRLLFVTLSKLERAISNWEQLIENLPFHHPTLNILHDYFFNEENCDDSNHKHHVVINDHPLLTIAVDLINNFNACAVSKLV